MTPEMTPEQAWAKLQEIETIAETAAEGNSHEVGFILAVKYLKWLMQDRIEQLKSIAGQK